MLTSSQYLLKLVRSSRFLSRSIAVPALLVAAVSPLGCGSSEPEVELRESEAVERQDGSSFNSAYADATKTYLSKRAIYSLKKLNAFSNPSLALAKRVDGIIASQPANGLLSTAELLTMEQPENFKYLLAAEKAELPTLWAFLETTSEVPAVLSARPTQSWDFKEAIVEPGTSLPAPLPYPIANLPEATWKVVAGRLQLGNDEDANPATVSLADLDAAIAAPGPFTPDELGWLIAVRDYLLANLASPLQARILVPETNWSIDHGDFGSGKLKEFRTDEYFQSPYGNSQYSSYVGIKILAPAKDQVLWICHSGDGQAEGIQEGNNGYQHLAINADGLCVLEHWSGGKRLNTGAIEFSGQAVRERGYNEFISAHPGFDLITPSGRVVNPWVERQPSKLPPGRYLATTPEGLNIAIDIFPQGVVRIIDLAANTVKPPLLLSKSDSTRWKVNAGWSNQDPNGHWGIGFEFDPANNSLFRCDPTLFDLGCDLFATFTAADRKG